jgi:hypothetical protein
MIVDHAEYGAAQCIGLWEILPFKNGRQSIYVTSTCANSGEKCAFG